MATETGVIKLKAVAEGFQVFDDASKKIGDLSKKSKVSADELKRMNIESGLASSAVGTLGTIVGGDAVPAFNLAQEAMSTFNLSLAGPAGLATVGVGAGLVLKQIIDLSAELVEVQGEAADAQAKSNEMTDRGRDLLKQIADEAGSSIAEFQEYGITLGNVRQKAEEGTTPLLGLDAALAAVTKRSIEAKAPVEKFVSGLDKIGIAARDTKQKFSDMGDEILAASGAMSDNDMEDEALALVDAFGKLDRRTGDSTASIQMMGGQISSLAALAKQLGFDMPQSFKDIAAQVDDSKDSVEEAAEMWSMYGKKAKDALDGVKKDIQETEEELSQFQSELESYKNFSATSDLGGGPVLEGFESLTPEQKRKLERRAAELDRAQNLGGTAKSAASSGDFSGVKDAATARKQQAEAFRKMGFGSFQMDEDAFAASQGAGALEGMAKEMIAQNKKEAAAAARREQAQKARDDRAAAQAQKDRVVNVYLDSALVSDGTNKKNRRGESGGMGSR